MTCENVLLTEAAPGNSNSSGPSTARHLQHPAKLGAALWQEEVGQSLPGEGVKAGTEEAGGRPREQRQGHKTARETEARRDVDGDVQRPRQAERGVSETALKMETGGDGRAETWPLLAPTPKLP